MKTKNSLRSFLAFAGSSLLAISSASADTIYWDGPSASWNLNTNWTTAAGAATPDPGAAPGSADDTIFNRTGQNGNITVTLDANQAAQSLTFNSTGGVTFRANNAAVTTARTLSIGTGGITVAANAGVVTFGNNSGTNGIVNLALTGNQTWTNNKAASTVTAEVESLKLATGNINYGANTFTIDGTGVTGFTGATITGSGNFIKNGAGTVVFSAGTGDNVAAGFTGNIFLNGGVARFQNTNNLGSGNININGGILEGRFGQTLTRTQGTLANQIQITGGVSGFSGQGGTRTTFNIGAITWGSATFNPTEFVLQSATTNPNGLGTLSSSIDLNGATRTIRSDQSAASTGSGTFSGVISNSSGTAAGLTKTGIGKHILTAANTYNGTTTITTGTLQLGDGTTGKDGTISNSLSVVNNAALVYNRFGTSTYGGVISGTGTVTKQGVGTQTLTGTNTYSGTTTITTGTLQLGNGTTGNDGTISNSLSLVNNAALVYNRFGTSTYSGVISGTGTVTKQGAGTQILSSATGNTYTGITTISTGTLLVNNTTGSGTGIGVVNVAANAFLGGSGRIAPTGSNGINVTGVLVPGGSVIGNITMDLTNTTGTVAMNSGSGFNFDLGIAAVDIGSVATGNGDRLTLAGASSGDFAFNSNIIDFLGTGSDGFYKLFDTSFDNSNTWTGLTFDGTSGVISNGLALTNLASGKSGSLLMGTASNGGTTGDIYLQVIPEPSTALLSALGVLALLRRKR